MFSVCEKNQPSNRFGYKLDTRNFPDWISMLLWMLKHLYFSSFFCVFIPKTSSAKQFAMFPSYFPAFYFFICAEASQTEPTNSQPVSHSHLRTRTPFLYCQQAKQNNNEYTQESCSCTCGQERYPKRKTIYIHCRRRWIIRSWVLPTAVSRCCLSNKKWKINKICTM